MNKVAMVAGIRMILRKNYGLREGVFDFESHVDSSLSYSENFMIIFKKCRTRGLIDESRRRY